MGLSQERFAQIAGVHRTYVGAVERCEKNVSVDNIERFATALGCTVPQLFEGHFDD
jgi:transcriptional regulator with XRE-family HTH domain